MLYCVSVDFDDFPDHSRRAGSSREYVWPCSEAQGSPHHHLRGFNCLEKSTAISELATEMPDQTPLVKRGGDTDHLVGDRYD
ncbi:hypothetical protein RUM43_008675 [Polyplax serrata]|uniref:Uncharacterized protein n=1 Tax=Polyplax serrata TaxID=468196 RepID=A0AAN8S855_POLSC